jgi:hypothetical protein
LVLVKWMLTMAERHAGRVMRSMFEGLEEGVGEVLEGMSEGDLASRKHVGECTSEGRKRA